MGGRQRKIERKEKARKKTAVTDRGRKRREEE